MDFCLFACCSLSTFNALRSPETLPKGEIVNSMAWTGFGGHLLELVFPGTHFWKLQQKARLLRAIRSPSYLSLGPRDKCPPPDVWGHHWASLSLGATFGSLVHKENIFWVCGEKSHLCGARRARQVRSSSHGKLWKLSTFSTAEKWEACGDD